MAASASVTLFIDRDVSSRRLEAALQEHAIPFIPHRQRFADDTPDEVWLAEVGRQGWVVVTRDKHIGRRPNELRAFRAASLHLFALTSGNLSAEQTAVAVCKAWPQIQRAVATHSPPAMFSISRAGSVQRLDR